MKIGRAPKRISTNCLRRSSVHRLSPARRSRASSAAARRTRARVRARLVTSVASEPNRLASASGGGATGWPGLSWRVHSAMRATGGGTDAGAEGVVEGDRPIGAPEAGEPAIVAGLGAAGDEPLGGLAHGVGGQDGPPLEVFFQAAAVLRHLVPREAHADDQRREPQGAEETDQEPHTAGLHRQAPNLVSLSALAMTSGIRCCAGSVPSVPAAHARSVKAVTGSAPQ